MIRFSILPLVAALSGCGLYPDKPPPAPAITRIPLSEAQENVVSQALASSFEGDPKPEFLHMNAGKDTSGTTFLCGKAKPQSGAFETATPYIVTLGKDNAVTPVAIGGSTAADQKVVQMCREKGLL